MFDDKYNQALLNTKERVFVSLLTIESGMDGTWGDEGVMTSSDGRIKIFWGQGESLLPLGFWALFMMNL